MSGWIRYRLFLVTIVILVSTILPTVSSSFQSFNQSSEPNFFLDDSKFNAMIYFVGLGSTANNEIKPVENNVYEIVSTSTFTPITIKANASGLTSWNLGSVKPDGWTDIMDFGNDSTTVGQFFVIIDGEISIVNTNFLGDFGIKVISPQGDHDITFLYLNKDKDSYHYVYDHIVVRIRPQASDFTNYKVNDFPVSFNLVDSFSSGEIRGKAVISVTGHNGPAFARNQFFEPDVDTTIEFNGSRIINHQEMILGNNSEFKISTTGNSTGFSGIQIQDKWDKIPGLWFYSDASGLHEFDESADSLTLREGNNYLGVFVFSPFGIWHSKITHPDNQENAGDQWGVSDLDGGPQGNVAAINEDGLSTIFVDSSHDFFGASDGISIRASLGEIETVSSKEDDSGLLGFNILIFVIIPILARFRREKVN